MVKLSITCFLTESHNVKLLFYSPKMSYSWSSVLLNLHLRYISSLLLNHFTGMKVFVITFSSLNLRASILFEKISCWVMLNKTKQKRNKQTSETAGNYLWERRTAFSFFFCTTQWLKGNLEQSRWETVSETICLVLQHLLYWSPGPWPLPFANDFVYSHLKQLPSLCLLVHGRYL